MSETRYYHLQTRPMEEVLPQLLGISLERGWRAVVITGFSDRVEKLNDHLWSFDTASFLPHGSEKDGRSEKHPVWITEKDENPNNSNVLFLVDHAESEALDSYETVCRLFDGNDEAAVQKARVAWKAEKDAGRSLTYWQQSEQGAWRKVADANVKVESE